MNNNNAGSMESFCDNLAVQKNVQNHENFSGLDFTTFFDNIGQNDYMLPPLNAGMSNINNCNNAQPSAWDWSAFNSGMTSAADVDMSIEGSQTPYHIKNITSVINNLASTNSKSCVPQLQQAVNYRLPMTQIKNTFNNNTMSNGNYSSEMNQIEGLLNTLTNGVGKINNYEADANRAFLCVNLALNLLNNSSDSDAMKSAYLIYLLSKKEACRYILYGCPNLSDTLINSLMKFRTNQTIVRHCVGSIHYLIENEKFVKQYRSNPNAVKVLCEAVQTNVDAIAFYAVATIHSLLVKFPDIRKELISTNIFEKLTLLVKLQNHKFVTVVIDVLHFLTIGNENVQLILPGTGLIEELIQLIKISKFEKLLFTVCRFIKSLSTNSALKSAFIRSGIMNVLTKLLLNNSRRLACSALWSLRNFSDVACTEQNLDDLIVICLRFIVSQTSDYDKMRLQKFTLDYDMSFLCSKNIGEPKLVSCAVGIITNITCNNKENKELLIKNGGIETLVTLCCNGYGYKEIIEPAMCALKHATAQNSFVEHTSHLLKTSNALAMFSSMLNPWYKQDDFFPQLKKAVLGTISNIIISNRNYITDLYQMNVLFKSIQIIRQSLEQLNLLRSYSIQNQNNSNINFGKEINVHEKLIEDSIVLIFIFVGTCTNSKEVLNQNTNMVKNDILKSLFTTIFIDTLGKLLFFDVNSILSCVIGILSAFSKINEGFNVIMQTFFPNGIEMNNNSLSSSIINQLNLISNGSNVESSIKNATASLLMNWSGNVNRSMQFVSYGSGNSSMIHKNKYNQQDLSSHTGLYHSSSPANPTQASLNMNNNQLPPGNAFLSASTSNVISKPQLSTHNTSQQFNINYGAIANNPNFVNNDGTLPYVGFKGSPNSFGSNQFDRQNLN